MFYASTGGLSLTTCTLKLYHTSWSELICYRYSEAAFVTFYLVLISGFMSIRTVTLFVISHHLPYLEVWWLN
jgi:hypothetical protein